MKIVRIKINDQGKIKYFMLNDILVKEDDLVILETEKGYQFGRVINVISLDNISQDLIDGKVLRVANERDYKKIKNNLRDAKRALEKCRELAKKYELNMNIIDAAYTFDRDQLLFRFLADERVDFRQLAKDLGAIFKTRIELRQVGIRDKAKEIGGIGPCGRPLCCANFLNEFESVSINMAKNQNLALNPTKINGVCGRLLCCLKYENENYNEYKKGLPEVNSKVKTEQGEGKVISIDIFNKTYKVLLDTSDVLEVSIKNNEEK